MGKINKKIKPMQKLLKTSSGSFSVPLRKLQQKFARKRFGLNSANNSSSNPSSTYVSQATASSDYDVGKMMLLDKEEQVVTQSARKVISKKAKLRLKHKNLMKKFDLLRGELKSERARRNREKTAIVGDLKPLKDALPSLDELYELSRNRHDLTSETTTANKKLMKSERIRLGRKQLIDNVNSYQQLLNDPNFKQSPRDAIRLHIKNTYIR